MYNNFERYNHTPDEYTYVHGYGFAPPPPQVSEKRTIRLYSNAIGLAIISMYLLNLIIPQFIYQIFSVIIFNFGGGTQDVLISPYMNEIVLGTTYTISLILPFLLYCIFLKIPLGTACPLRKPNMSVATPAVIIAMGVSVIGVFGSNIISSFMYSLGMYSYVPEIAPSTGFFGVVLFITNYAILPALVEEFVFRGVIMQSLRRFGDTFALFASTILFAAIHGNLVQAPYAFLMGLVIGYFVLRTGSLWTGVLIHLANNLLSVILTIMSDYLVGDAVTLIAYILNAAFIIFAVMAVMYLEKNDSEIFSLKASNTVSLENHKFLFFFGSASMIISLILVLMLTINSLQAF